MDDAETVLRDLRAQIIALNARGDGDPESRHFELDRIVWFALERRLPDGSLQDLKDLIKHWTFWYGP